jgi:two-component system CheB/CheR fusion protein
VPLVPALPLVPVVGVGASAGGLEALERFFSMVPATCGVAFVVVQHLDPTRKGMLADILQKSTALAVVEAADGMPLAPNRVYVIPPNRDLAVAGSTLLVREVGTGRGLRLPVDVLFRSAAGAAGANAMGIILTGMGDDGARCLGEMKQAGSPTIAQDEASSVVYGMPREAVKLGSAVQSVALDRIAAAIMSFARRHKGVQA